MAMLRFSLGVLLVLSLSCHAPEEAVLPAPVSDPAWTVVSANGGASLSQTGSTADPCVLRCDLQNKQVWTQHVCLAAGGTDFAFVSADCATALLIYEYPLRAERSESTVVAAAVRESGPVFFTLEQVVERPASLKGEGRRVRWLAGVVGEPGAKPRFNGAKTAIEFASIGGVIRTVRFSDPKDFLVRPAAQPEDVALYSYPGADGSTQFVKGLSQVPARFRKRATRVGAEISTVRGEALPSRPPEPPPPGFPFGPYVEPPRPAIVAKPPPPPRDWRIPPKPGECVSDEDGSLVDCGGSSGQKVFGYHPPLPSRTAGGIKVPPPLPPPYLPPPFK